MIGKLSDKTDFNILIDTGASQSYMSKSFYMQSKVLHTLPKFAPTTQRIQVGNGQYVAVLFVIPVIIEIHRHLFEVFILVSEIHDNVDLVLGMKNAYELEGIVGTQDSSFKFLNRSMPFFSKEQTVVKPKEKKFVKIEAPFIVELSGHAIVKMIDNEGRCTVVLKLKFVRNCASLDIVNNSQETVIFDPNQILGILDLRSLGYYKIKQGVLQHNLSKNYHFESVEKFCEEFNAIINERKKERGIKVPEVHGPKKGIDPNLRPEWLVKKAQKPVENSRIEKRETNSPEQRNQIVDQVNLGQRDEIRKSQMQQSRENIPEQIYVPQKPIIPIHPNQISNPIPKLPERVIQNDKQTDLELDLEINKDFEENSPYQEGIMSEIYQRPHKSKLVDPPELTDLVNTEKIVQKYLPKTGRYR